MVKVDFAHPQKAGNALGFMHGALARLAPTLAARYSARAEQLRPGVWRGVPRAWSLDLPSVVGSGARPIIVLSDLWGLPGHWPTISPLDDPSRYEAWVHRQARALGAQMPTGLIWVDVWNEPDTGKFWPVADDPHLHGYMETFLLAERALRSELGSRVRVIGPSTSKNPSLWTGRLIGFCARRGCRIDAVAWHVCGGGKKTMGGLAASLRRARRKAKADRIWHRVLRPGAQFLIAEYTPPAQRRVPGALLAYWAQIEAGGADNAALATWDHGRPQDGLLDALLDLDGRPRATWWAARAYAIGRVGRVRTSSSSPEWPALATRRGTDGLREILLGSWGSSAGRVRVRVAGLPNGRYLMRVGVMYPVGSSWTGTDVRPIQHRAGAVRVVHGQVTLSIRVPKGAVLSVQLGSR